ncbi:20S proteasome subunit A/B [Candidatus Acetothermia bacterium]|nr:20S proteasome subunit A/B [Candidatus Acetothermia bacterium]MBI3460557.1 20S proteasome subunit A/B [Candidatus Acetothermia bacterium]MBI3661304.1 20S proteasome subunit A/B [Candidatus Acetothermia bacterium]
MAYTPYDWQQVLQQKADYVEDRLRQGSPVVAVSCQEGILLLTVRRNQRKIFEVYDRLAFSGLGQQSDLEAVRQVLVDFTHSEGFQRSTEDVSIQRVVGLAISPVLKRAFSDPTKIPLVLRGLFAQVEDRPEDDLFYTLDFDGEFSLVKNYAAVAGTDQAHQAMEKILSELDTATSPENAFKGALQAWVAGRWQMRHGSEGEDKSNLGGSESERKTLLRETLESANVEAALLERDTHRERRFRLLDKEEINRYMPRL